jgi:hypothetical protein
MSPALRIERAMRQSQRIMEKAAVEHGRAFTSQMREKIGVAEVALNEPYLPFALVHGELVYLRRLDKLQKRWSEVKLARIDIPGKPPADNGIELLEDEEGEGFGEGNDVFDDEDIFDSELESDIDLETNRALLEFKQDLDGHRQQAFGISQYVWVGGSCPLCAPNNGEIFEWGEGDEPGDVHPNCDCSADPVIEDLPYDPPIEPVYPIEDLIALLTGGGLARKLGMEAIKRVTGDKLPSAVKPRAENPKDILSPNGQFIGKPGNRPEVRIEKGGDEAARELYKRLSKGGVPDTPPGYPGEGTRLPNGDWVGYRPNSRSGSPTVDINIHDISFDRIHFL